MLLIIPICAYTSWSVLSVQVEKLFCKDDYLFEFRCLFEQETLKAFLRCLSYSVPWRELYCVLNTDWWPFWKHCWPQVVYDGLTTSLFALLYVYIHNGCGTEQELQYYFINQKFLIRGFKCLIFSIGSLVNVIPLSKKKMYWIYRAAFQNLHRLAFHRNCPGMLYFLSF